jgi:hypothetical protein
MRAVCSACEYRVFAVLKGITGTGCGRYVTLGRSLVPRIFDNMDLTLVSALRENLPAVRRFDVSVGYFNLRGWRLIDHLIGD